MSDYKDSIQTKADELADQKFGKDFYELSDEQQHEVYSEAMGDVNDKLLSLGDRLRDAAKYKGSNHG